MSSRSFVFVVAVALGWSPAPARADYVARQCTGPAGGAVEVLVKDGACVGYRVTEPGGKRRQVDFGFLGSGKLVASRDGRTVVMIQSYLLGGVDAAGDVVELVGASERKNPVVVFVFRDGRLVASHRIHDLLTRKKQVQPSVSHVSWVREAPTVIGERFTITTTSFRAVTFDARTGRIVRQADAPEWGRCEVIATGTLDLVKGRLRNAFSHKTETRDPEIPFVLDKGLGLTDRAAATVCLERRGGSLHLTKAL
jgi:hypothetical protein